MSNSWTPTASEPLIDRLRRAVIGRYDVYAELGQGGMASVFLAQREDAVAMFFEQV